MSEKNMKEKDTLIIATAIYLTVWNKCISLFTDDFCCLTTSYVHILYSYNFPIPSLISLPSLSTFLPQLSLPDLWLLILCWDPFIPIIVICVSIKLKAPMGVWWCHGWVFNWDTWFFYPLNLSLQKTFWNNHFNTNEFKGKISLVDWSQDSSSKLWYLGIFILYSKKSQVWVGNKARLCRSVWGRQCIC